MTPKERFQRNAGMLTEVKQEQPLVGITEIVNYQLHRQGCPDLSTRKYIKGGNFPETTAGIDMLGYTQTVARPAEEEPENKTNTLTSVDEADEPEWTPEDHWVANN